MLARRIVVCFKKLDKQTNALRGRRFEIIKRRRGDTL